MDADADQDVDVIVNNDDKLGIDEEVQDKADVDVGVDAGKNRALHLRYVFYCAVCNTALSSCLIRLSRNKWCLRVLFSA